MRHRITVPGHLTLGVTHLSCATESQYPGHLTLSRPHQSPVIKVTHAKSSTVPKSITCPQASCNSSQKAYQAAPFLTVSAGHSRLSWFYQPMLAKHEGIAATVCLCRSCSTVPLSSSAILTPVHPECQRQSRAALVATTVRMCSTVQCSTPQCMKRGNIIRDVMQRIVDSWRHVRNGVSER